MKLPEIAFPARPNKQKKNQNCKIESVQTSKGFTTTTIVPLRSTNELEPWYHNNKSGALLIESSWDFLLRYPGLFDKRVPPLSTWTSSLSPHCPLAKLSVFYAFSPRLRLPVLLPWLGFQFLPTLPYPWASSPSSSASFNQAFSPFPTLPISLTKIPSPLLLLTQTSVLSSLALSPPSKPPLVNTLAQASSKLICLVRLKNLQELTLRLTLAAVIVMCYLVCAKEDCVLLLVGQDRLPNRKAFRKLISENRGERIHKNSSENDMLPDGEMALLLFCKINIWAVVNEKIALNWKFYD